jgi:tol-pal system protein YbgF
MLRSRIVRGAWVAALLVAFVSSACATRASVSRAQADVAALGNEIEALRHSQEQAARDATRSAADLSVTQTRLTQLSSQISTASVVVGRLSARVDETEIALAQLREVVEHVRDVDRVRAPTPPADPPRAPAVDAPARADAPERAYAVALEVFHAREHGQAVLDLLGFLGRYPKHPLASNAQYWIGEAYYAQRDFRQATVEFQKVLDQNPRGAKAPDALLKIGLCYVNLRQLTRAQGYWQQVLSEYPNSAPARKATTLLQGRGVSSRRPP